MLNGGASVDYYEEKILAKKAMDLRPARKAFSRVGLAFFMMMVMFVATQIASMVVLKWAFPNGLQSSFLVYSAILLPMYLVTTTVCVIFLRRVEPWPIQQKSITFGYFVGFLLMCMPIMYAGKYIGTFVTNFIEEEFGYFSSESLGELILGQDLLSNFVFIGLVAPIIEEILFRKLLIERIVKYGEGIAVFTSALMFGLFHGNFTQFFYAFGVGLLFGYIYCRTGKIRYSIILHMIINTMNSVLIPYIINMINWEPMQELIDMRRMNKDFAREEELLEEAMPGVLVVIVLALGIILFGIIGLVLLIISRKRFILEKTENQIPEGKRFLTVWMNIGMLLFIAGCVGLFGYTYLYAG